MTAATDKARETRRRNKAAKVERLERRMTELNDEYLTAKLHGDPCRDIFTALRETGREWRRARYAA